MSKPFKNFFSNIVILTGVFLACYLLVGQIIEVSGDSMQPAIKNGMWVLAEKISPKFGDFRRGEIVVFYSPVDEKRLLIKRVVGLPNETLKIKYGAVYINGQHLTEPYILENVLTVDGKSIAEGQNYKIGENEYAMLGDNRDNSVDSREYGAVKKESVLGRALFVYRPLKNFKLLLSLPQE